MACRLADAAQEVHARGKPDIRRIRRDRRNELWEEHVSARPIRYFAAVALWALPNHAGAQSPATVAPEVLRVTRTADDPATGRLVAHIALDELHGAAQRLQLSERALRLGGVASGDHHRGGAAGPVEQPGALR